MIKAFFFYYYATTVSYTWLYGWWGLICYVYMINTVHFIVYLSDIIINKPTNQSYDTPDMQMLLQYKQDKTK